MTDPARWIDDEISRRRRIVASEEKAIEELEIARKWISIMPKTAPALNEAKLTPLFDGTAKLPDGANNGNDNGCPRCVVPPEVGDENSDGMSRSNDLFGLTISEAAKRVLEGCEPGSFIEYHHIAQEAMERGYRSHKSSDPDKIVQSFLDILRRNTKDFVRDGRYFRLRLPDKGCAR